MNKHTSTLFYQEKTYSNYSHFPPYGRSQYAPCSQYFTCLSRRREFYYRQLTIFIIKSRPRKYKPIQMAMIDPSRLILCRRLPLISFLKIPIQIMPGITRPMREGLILGAIYSAIYGHFGLFLSKKYPNSKPILTFINPATKIIFPKLSAKKLTIAQFNPKNSKL